MSVCGTQTKPWSDVKGRSKIVSEVPRCQTMKTAVHHDAQLIDDYLWHVQPMELIVQECRQTAVERPCVTGHMCGRIEHSLQLVSDRLRRPCIQCIATVDARRNKSMNEHCRWSVIKWLSDSTKLMKPSEASWTRLKRHASRDAGRTKKWLRAPVHDHWQSQYLSGDAGPVHGYPTTKCCVWSQPRAIQS